MTRTKTAGAARDLMQCVALLAAMLALAACAGETKTEESERFVDMPLTWKPIDLAEADLTLPLATPAEISALGKRVGEGQVFENLYTFHGLKGYVLTSRVVFAYYTSRVSRRLRSPGDFKQFVHELSLPPGGAMQGVEAKAFKNGDPHTQGFYGRAAAPPYHDRCFVARIGYLMVDYASVRREADSVDTIVSVLLCGNLPSEATLLNMLETIRAVEDRDAFRAKLSKQPIGTI